jgi:5-methylcytosine-specific restriction endonuclease McrA
MSPSESVAGASESESAPVGNVPTPAEADPLGQGLSAFFPQDHGPARVQAREPVPQARPRARGNQYEENDADREAAWLARGWRTRGRKMATREEWAAIREAKLANSHCRACFVTSMSESLELHHLVPRAMGGDDVVDNLVPLCQDCHAAVTARHPMCLDAVSRRLSDGEHAYIVGKIGEGGMGRLFGV